MLLKNIRLNQQTNLYETVEAGIVYQIDPALQAKLQKYFGDNPYKLIADWYSGLDDADREKVKRSSAFNKN